MDDVRRALASGRLRQPDSRTCGSSVLVAVGLLAEPATTPPSDDAFAKAALAMHARTNRWWPRALGTTPWAVAKQLSGHALRYRVHGARLFGRRRAWARLNDAVNAGSPVAIYVGNRWLPRHVVLALPRENDDAPDGVQVYEPAHGNVVHLTPQEWTTSHTALAGWRTPWFVITPRR